MAPINPIKYIWISPTKENELFQMLRLGYLIILIMTKAEAFCGERTNLSVAEGRLVVLHPEVAETEELSIIYWIRDDASEIAAIRYINITVQIENNRNEEKFNISHDGSLTVKNFTVEDQGVYVVIIKRMNQSDCTHMYYVTISERVSPCGEVRDVSGREEEEITLSLYTKGAPIKLMYWFSPRRDLLAKTKPNGYIQAQSHYDRRLQTLQDGSLTIMKLSVQDQGIYTTNVHMYNGESCVQMYNVTISSVSPEQASIKKVYVYSREEQKVTLPLPEHLANQVEDILWMKDNVKHIATTFKDGALHVLDSSYQGRLLSADDGSLVILDLRVEDRGQYSADIHLTNAELYTEIYHVGIYRKSYYLSLGTRTVNVTEGGDLILPVDVKDVESVDWLTQRWVQFSATKPGGSICIFDRSYSNRLSSLNDGSLTIHKASKKDKGLYRAHMFSHNGMILEQQYLVTIHDDPTELYVLVAVLPLALIALMVLCYCCVIRRHCIF